MEIEIDDGNFYMHLQPPYVDGELKERGLEPRDLFQCPKGSIPCARPFDLPLIPESEWQSRLDAQIAAKAQLSDIRNRGMYGQQIPALDQDGYGYCWAHSSTSAAMLCRAINNEPYVRLSAFAVACIIKGYRNQGGYGAESLQFIAERGIPSVEFWPEKSTSRANDNPNTWQNAAQHKFTEWMDLDRGQMKQQLVTCLLLGIPVVSDFNWWSHSVCTIDLVSINPFKTRILNSWTNSWSQEGTGVLVGSKAIPDDALAPRIMTASLV